MYLSHSIVWCMLLYLFLYFATVLSYLWSNYCLIYSSISQKCWVVYGPHILLLSYFKRDQCDFRLNFFHLSELRFIFDSYFMFFWLWSKLQGNEFEFRDAHHSSWSLYNLDFGRRFVTACVCFITWTFSDGLFLIFFCKESFRFILNYNSSVKFVIRLGLFDVSKFGRNLFTRDLCLDFWSL